MSREESIKSWIGPLPAIRGCECHICQPDLSYDQMDRQTIDAVLQHGWQVMLISDEVACNCLDHDAHELQRASSIPAFAYTLGLGHRAGHPEIFMSGLDLGLMHRCINQLAQRVMDGHRFAAGDVIEDILAGVPVALEAIADEALAETVPWSGWFHRRPPEALAVVWPTRSGLFPWQPGAPRELHDGQPLRWRVPEAHKGGVAPDPEWVFPVPPDQRVFSCTHVVERGDAILWAARQHGVLPAQTPGERPEDWTIHCGAEGHADEDMCMAHLAHLVRSSPGLRDIGSLPLEHEALRQDAHSPWQIAPLG